MEEAGKMNEQRVIIDGELEHMKRVLSGNIKHYRKMKRISQQGLADICGLHRTYISDLENAKCNPTLSVLLMISHCLGVKLQDLLKENE
jgi:transcriptional regulator with XRE-family HTH domain